MLRAFCLGAVIASACSGAGRGQDSALAGDVPTLRTQTRLVLEDVLVMDAKGNPVHGLPASAFHIQDNGHPQRIRDFEEGSPQPDTSSTSAVTPLPPGTFSNAPAAAAAHTIQVLLIDTDDIELLDQMFLLKQLQKSFAAMPADLPVAVFAVRDGRTFPVLPATTDRAALTRAVAEVLPVQNHAIDSKFQSAVDQLMTLAAYLQQNSGRKNLMWFAGEFPLVSAGADASASPQADFQAREHMIHQVQEALSEARVSVYPVDVRGVIQNGIPVPTANNGGLAPQGGAGAGPNPRAVNAASQKRGVAGPPPSSAADQRSEMRELAATTGGRAYMLNNLAEEIDQAFDLGKSAYTLSYTPTPYNIDQSFHAVAITVDGGYTVSYRRGYLATFTGTPDAEPRTRLTSEGARPVDPNQNQPIVFQVHLQPKQDAQHITVHVSVPTQELTFHRTDSLWTNTLIVTSYAYDIGGKVRDGKVQELATRLTADQYQQAQSGKKTVAATEELSVPKGAKYLLVYVRDKESQRTGSILLQTRILASLAQAATASAIAPRGNTPPVP